MTRLFNPNLIVLDLDGVLNCTTMYETGEEIKQFKGDVCSVKKIEMLNDLVDEVNAEILLSASCRVSEYVDEMFEYFGLKKKFIGKTPSLGRGNLRGNAIRMWIQQNEDLLGVCGSDYNNYVILDDDSDMLLWQQHNFIHVDRYAGLTENHCYKIKRFFRERNNLHDPKIIEKDKTLIECKLKNVVRLVDCGNSDRSLESYNRLFLSVISRYPKLTSKDVCMGYFDASNYSESSGLVKTPSIFLEFNLK